MKKESVNSPPNNPKRASFLREAELTEEEINYKFDAVKSSKSKNPEPVFHSATDLILRILVAIVCVGILWGFIFLSLSMDK